MKVGASRARYQPADLFAGVVREVETNQIVVGKTARIAGDAEPRATGPQGASGRTYQK
ncbi:MAG: hypothetical protein ACREL7_08535 [Longimicrobiales bacterium]